MRHRQFVVIGGGPAGLSAAITAATHGARVAVYDENPRAGGQYFRQMPESFGAAAAPILGKEHRERQSLLRDLDRLPIEWNPNITVWGLFPEKTLGVFDGRAADLIRAECLLLAVGAYDRPMPFPGWTLPGVITAGAAQNLMKGQGITPGHRVLLSGTGPLQLVVANNLLKAGARVLAVCEASSMRLAWRQLPNLWGHWGLLRDGWRYLSGLRRHQVRLLRGYAVIRAEGSDHVETATAAALDERGHPIPGTEERFAVDSLVLGYGFVPSTELPRLAGCEHRYAAERAAWLPVVTRAQESSVPGVLIAGDGAGVGGSNVAREQGRIAGLQAAHRLGLLSAPDAEALMRPILARLDHLQKFRQALDVIYPPPTRLLTLANDRTVICRCEEVVLSDLKAAVADGAATPTEIKVWTRCGMGRCQGRICGPTLALLAARLTGKSEEDSPLLSPRVPIRPVPFGALAELDLSGQGVPTG